MDVEMSPAGNEKWHDMRELQEDVCAWSQRNFGPGKPLGPLLGAIEEVGELALAHYRGFLRNGCSPDAVPTEYPPVVMLAACVGEIAHAVLKESQGIRQAATSGDLRSDLRTFAADLRSLCEKHRLFETSHFRIGECGPAARADAVADIIIYLTDYCNRNGLDVAAIVAETWSKVRQRDWKANPATGVAPEELP